MVYPYTYKPNHDCYCTCEMCHEMHIERGEWRENAVDDPNEFTCCADYYELQIEKGNVCPQHPKSDAYKYECSECGVFRRQENENDKRHGSQNPAS